MKNNLAYSIFLCGCFLLSLILSLSLSINPPLFIIFFFESCGKPIPAVSLERRISAAIRAGYPGWLCNRWWAFEYLPENQDDRHHRTFHEGCTLAPPLRLRYASRIAPSVNLFASRNASGTLQPSAMYAVIAAEKQQPDPCTWYG